MTERTPAKTLALIESLFTRLPEAVQIEFLEKQIHRLGWPLKSAHAMGERPGQDPSYESKTLSRKSTLQSRSKEGGCHTTVQSEIGGVEFSSSGTFPYNVPQDSNMEHNTNTKTQELLAKHLKGSRKELSREARPSVPDTILQSYSSLRRKPQLLQPNPDSLTYLKPNDDPRQSQLSNVLSLHTEEKGEDDVVRQRLHSERKFNAVRRLTASTEARQLHLLSEEKSNLQVQLEQLNQKKAKDSKTILKWAAEIETSKIKLETGLTSLKQLKEAVQEKQLQIVEAKAVCEDYEFILKMIMQNPELGQID